MKTFTKSVEEFLEEATWLTGEDAPMVVALQHMAAELDREFVPATMSQFGLAFRFLAKKGSKGDGSIDPLEEVLRRGD